MAADLARPVSQIMGSRRKVVLYNPWALFHTMPLPLVAVASALDRHRYDVTIIDARLGDGLERVLDEIGDAVCLGVTVHTGAPIRDALRVSRAAKARRPDLPVVWGGWYPSLLPLDPLADPAIDVTIQGQGELSFADVVDRLAAGEPPTGVAGTASRCGNTPAVNPARSFQDVNELPTHDYAHIDVERYFRAKRQRQLDYVASMGCRFRCAFCADPLVFKRKWTILDPARASAEIEGLWRRYQFTDLSFQDETLFTSIAWIAHLADTFLSRGLRFTWFGTMRADQGERMPEDVWRLAARSGLRRVLIGVEAGSQEMLDWLQKDVRLDEVFRAAESCRRHGIGAVFPFIVGFPGESDDSMEATLDVARRLRLMSPHFDTPVFYYKPYPGSPIARTVEEHGYRLPASLEEWTRFEFVSSSGPWVSAARRERIERYKFYNRFAGGPETWRRWPLQKLARWRMNRNFYGMPVEKVLVNAIRPAPDLA